MSFFEQLYKNTKGSDTYRARSSLQALAVRTSNRWLRELTFSPPLCPLTQGGVGGRGWGTSWRRRGDPQISDSGLSTDHIPYYMTKLRHPCTNELLNSARIASSFKIRSAYSFFFGFNYINQQLNTQCFRLFTFFNACLTHGIPLLFHICPFSVVTWMVLFFQSPRNICPMLLLRV